MNLHSHFAFYLLHFALLSSCHKGQRLTCLACTTSAADTVNIVVVRTRFVIVDDVSDIWDIDPACSDVSRDEDIKGIVFEVPYGDLASTLRLVSVDGPCLESSSEELGGQVISTTLCTDEDECFDDTILLENRLEHVPLGFAMWHADDVLIHIISGR